MDPADLDGLFAELVEDAETELVPLTDAARSEVWVSGILGIWRQPGFTEGLAPAQVDARFAAYLEAHPSAAAAAIAAGMRALGLGGPASVAAGDLLPAWAEAAGSARPEAAWVVDGRSVVIGFRHDDDVAHTLLAELDPEDGDRLVTLLFGPDPAELLGGLGGDDDEPAAAAEVVGVDPAEAAERIARAWASGPVDPGDDGILMNGVAAAARLRALVPGFVPGEGAVAVPGLVPGEGAVAVPEDAASEWAEEDAAALRALQAALARWRGAPRPADGEDLVAPVAALVNQPVRAPLPDRERDAVASLEWADWLGSVIELVRAGPGTTVDPAGMVDRINRCPEITSAVPARDRPAVEWAFSVVLAEWRTAGVVDEGWRLTPAGAWALPRGLASAWGGAFD